MNYIISIMALGLLIVLFLIPILVLVKVYRFGYRVDLTDRQNFKISSFEIKVHLNQYVLKTQTIYFIEFCKINIWGEKVWRPVTHIITGMNRPYEQILTFAEFDEAAETISNIIQQNIIIKNHLNN